MLDLKAYRYRIYPDKDQQILFRKTVGCRRFVYNLCLDQKKLDWHRSEPERLSAFDQIKQLPALKAEVPWLAEVPNHALQQAVIDLHKAYRNFFEGRADYPTFQRKSHSRGSFRLPDPKQIKIEESRILLPKAGWVEMVMHRQLRGKVKNATVSMTAGDWHVSVQTEEEVAEPATNLRPAVGIDLGIAQAVVLSDGTVYAMPSMEDGDHRRLAAAQKIFARRKKGSNNRRKAGLRVARLRAKQARRRLDAAHRITAKIAKNHGVIAVEDLAVKNMTASARGTMEDPGTNVAQKAGLNRSLLDVAPATFRRLLEYKAVRRGGRVVAVNPAYTSQTCNACGAKDAASRVTQSSFVCTSCGHSADADVNAAKNILRRALTPTGGFPGMACGSSRGGGRKQERMPVTA